MWVAFRRRRHRVNRLNERTAGQQLRDLSAHRHNHRDADHTALGGAMKHLTMGMSDSSDATQIW